MQTQSANYYSVKPIPEAPDERGREAAACRRLTRGCAPQNKYLTQERCVIHLVVVMIGRGVAAAVLSTPLPVGLPAEAEEGRRPCAETVGLLEHRQRELLRTRGTNVLRVFYESSDLFFSLQSV